MKTICKIVLQITKDSIMTDLKTVNRGIASLKKNLAIAVLIWTAMITASFFWYYDNESDKAVELAKKEALTVFKKNMAFRYWGTKHGGVYVPVTKETPSNKYLKNIPERDIITPSGKKLTLMNPAYMMRQIMEEYSELYNVRGHITSRKLLNPENAPDDWERHALENFENGVREVFEIVPSAREDNLRLMRSLYIKEGCLKCHEHQGYKIGDVRGGVSATVPMSAYYRLRHNAVRDMAITYTLIWLSGLFSMGFIFRRTKIRLIERKQAEAELAKHREHLETLVDERTIALKEKVEQHRQAEEALKESERHLKKAKDDAEAANYAKSAFLANMSHELRTPLHAILGFSRMIGRSQPLLPEHRENLDTVIRSGEHLLRLINDVLDMSELETGRMRLADQDFDLYCLTDELEEKIRVRAEAKGLELVFTRSPETPRYMRTDRDRLRQILENLLDNAVKFTEEGKVSVRVAGCELRISGGRGETHYSPAICLCFEVEDTGPGIPPDVSDTLFEPFVQTKNADGWQEGSGLGLAISYRFVQLMGGTMTVISPLPADGKTGGPGSLFRFYIQSGLAHASDIRAVPPESHEDDSATGERRLQKCQADLTSLPTELVMQLRYAAIAGDTDEMEVLTEEIRIYDAESANAIAVLAHDYEHDKILKLIDKQRYANDEHTTHR